MQRAVCLALLLAAGPLRAEETTPRPAPVDPPALAEALRLARAKHPALTAARLRAGANAAQDPELRRLTLDVERDLRLAWLDAWQAAQLLRLNLRDIQLAAQLESAASAGVAAAPDAMSSTGRPDPLAWRAESLLASEVRMDLLQSVTDAHARLQMLTGRETPPDPGDFPVALPLAFETDAPWLTQTALANHPGLRAPAAPVPGEGAEAQAAEADRAALRDRLRAEVRIRAAAVNNLRHHESLYRLHLLPLREQQADRARAEFEAGPGSLAAVLEARRMLTRDQAMHVRHQADAWRETTRLEHLCGGGWIVSPPGTP